MATDYARLAKRISATTTNCLLTAVVLVAGLVFGRQVLRWWAADPAQSPDASPPRGYPAEILDGLGDPRRPHTLQFGDQPWSLRRQSITGDRQAAATALRAACREVIRQDRPPDQPPAPAETNLLSRLAARDPAEQAPGKWRLYELTESLPMVVGTRPQPAAADPPPGKNPAAMGDRVVVLGVAMPMGSEGWTLFSFQPEGPDGQHPAGLPEVPIPAGCRKTFSMGVAGGGAMFAFEGLQGPETWINFYDRWFAAHDWKTIGGWQESGTGWHARYAPPAQDPAAFVDVHLGSDGPHRSTGLLLLSPSPSGRGPG
jgi:hypothetical protein